MKIENSLRAGDCKAVEEQYEELAPKISKAWARTLVAYLFKTRIDSLAPDAPELAPLSARLSEMLGKDQRNLYMGSSSDKMLAEGKIRLLPAETEHSMDEREKIISKFKSYRQEISDQHQLIYGRSNELQKLAEQHAGRKIPKDAKKEIQKLEKEIEALKAKAPESQRHFDEAVQPEYEEMLFTSRENTALERIAEIADSEHKIIPLVYGSKHDFTDNVNKYNLEHPDNKIGLIEINTSNSESEE